MSNEIAHAGRGNGFEISGMKEAFELAKAMSSAKMVPQCLQNSPGDCLMVIEQAMRWSMSPFAVAQATSVVKGKLCFEGKLVSAAIQSSGVLEGRLNYKFTGEGDTRKVICSGTIKGEREPRTVEVALQDARTENMWWRKTPDQMLTYHSARVWARRHTPEVMLGVYSPDEFDATEKISHSSEDVIDAEDEPSPPKTEPEETPEQKAKRLAGQIMEHVQKITTLNEINNFIISDAYKNRMITIRKHLSSHADMVEDNVEVVRTRLQNAEKHDDFMQEMPA